MPVTIIHAIEFGLRSWPAWFNNSTLPPTLPEKTTALAEFLISPHESSYPLLCRGTRKWPIAVWTNCHPASRDVDSLLGSLNHHFTADNTLSDARHLEKLQHNCNYTLYNGPSYILENAVMGNNTLTLNCGRGRYFDALMTCDTLNAELAHAFPKGVPTDRQSLLKSCPKRHAFLSKCPDPAFSGKGRSAAIGISILIACRYKNRYYGLLGTRSRKVATDPGRCHVIPSGMFTADTDDAINEFSIYHNFLREYQEELFEGSDLKAPDKSSPHDWFYQRSPLHYLMGLMDRGRARLLVSGYALNLMNYRPEVLLLLAIDDQGWLHQQLAAHDEFTDSFPANNRGRGYFLPIDLSAPEAEVSILLDNLASGMVPPAAAALWAGRDALQQLVGL